jgi:hypothetical protein
VIHYSIYFFQVITTSLNDIVAEEMRAPLYSLSAGELGESAGSIERALTSVLELVTKWNAVLLLDEADVFLEQRDFSNLERNKIVSSKFVSK